MKKSLLSLILVFSTIHALTAQNKIAVREFGAGGAYASISEALAAAAPGDIITVQPLTDNRLWNEDITITKSVTLVSESDDARFRLGGTIKVVPGADLSRVHINGVANIRKMFTEAAATQRTKIEIINCQFTKYSPFPENLIFDQDNYEVTMIHNSFDGVIIFRSGHFIGNIVDNGEVSLLDESPSRIPPSMDKIIFEGNRIRSMSSSYQALKVHNDDYEYIFRNNGFNSHRHFILVSLAKPNSKVTGLNNTFLYSGSGLGNSAYYITTPVSELIFMNNFARASSGVGWYNGNIKDYVDKITDAYNVISSSSNSISFPTFIPNPISVVQDLGHPDASFTDHDLTRNDLGAYGGPYSIQNHLNNDGVSPRIYYLDVPNRIITGSTITVKAGAIDQ